MRGPADLRDWIDMLRRAGELVEIRAEVDPVLEITEIADRALKGGGPALLFTNVKGSDVPVLINQFGTERRMLMAMGRDGFDEIGEEIAARAASMYQSGASIVWYSGISSTRSGKLLGSSPRRTHGAKERNTVAPISGRPVANVKPRRAIAVSRPQSLNQG